jgi:hypothetical protein
MSAPQISNTAERERHAYNAAFGELDLDWHWDAQTFHELASCPCETERLRRFLARQHGHLLQAYDIDFLAQAIGATRARCAAEAGNA